MSSAEKERLALLKGRICSAKECRRGGITQLSNGWVCNLHYQRHLMHGAFDLPHRDVSRHVKCFTCDTNFDRGYAINATRAAKPQFCSSACRNIHCESVAEATAEDRFWSYVDKRGPDDCWEWKANRSPSGYGKFMWRRGRTQMASRVAYHFSKGDPGTLFVCHSCDNPPCCNPAHLWLGTHQDNMDDMDRKGRRKVSIRRGADNNNTKLNEKIVREIRQSSLPQKDLAQRYGVTTTAIYLIRKRQNWRWVA